MIYLSAQPDRLKFYWQLVAQLHNFKAVGIPLDQVQVLVGCDQGPPSAAMQHLARHSGARVFFYPYVSGGHGGYVPAVRPQLLAQHYAAHKNLKYQYVFYLDSDVIFNRLPQYELLPQDGRWYLSDTRNYLGAQYLLRCGGPQVFMDMCSTVGIDPFSVIEREDQTGGAQYVLHGVDADFWQDVERDCVNLHSLWQRHQRRYAALGQRPVQWWCADMWAVLWNAWKRRKQTILHDELSFAWGHHPAIHNEQRVMLHLSGVTVQTQKNGYGPHFDKLQFDQTVPFGKLPYVNAQSASYKYALILKTIEDDKSYYSPPATIPPARREYSSPHRL